jgi:hypothetical protein
MPPDRRGGVVTTLTEFLLTCIAEDEGAARFLPETRWYVDEDGCLEIPDGTWADGEDYLPNHHNSWYLVLDPARVLAECAAKRRIVELHGDNSVGSCSLCATRDTGDPLPYPCQTLRLLAMPYAGHPDYDGSWAS